MQKIVVNHASLAKLLKTCVKQTMWAFVFYPCSSNFENLSQDLLLWWHCKCRLLRATTTCLLHHSYELATSSVGTLSSTKFELSRTDSCGLKLFCLVKPTNWNWESHKLSDYFIFTLTRLRNKDTMCDGSNPVYRTHMRGTGQRRKLHAHTLYFCVLLLHVFKVVSCFYLKYIKTLWCFYKLKKVSGVLNKPIFLLINRIQVFDF